ncbi:GntR family transcriptional regulator [Spirochaeta isovalerica]|uniref:DNA-binding LacI/PurR family transcriptional regulator n=1 Tax=Spirochaeta isovalerica TaxID=150 RepID=A0A841R7U6_9SPIO|nr:GntR family transcriptional regulator [Spirochaeta isovalerica]MBB6479933.1 DNA-binding LacI/PurR family transcriptional regulator [Spirochaeta isovalerica]
MASDKKPLYEIIYRQYKIKILSGELPPGTRLPTEMEIAGEFKVSRITVTRALKELELEKFIRRVKGSGSYVTEKEWQSASDSSSSPSGNKNGLNFISLILPFDEEFSTIFLKGIEDEAKKKGFLVTFHNTAEDSDQEVEIIEDVLSKGSRGLIIYPFSETSNLHMYSSLLIRKFPFVLIDRKIPGIETSIVSVDNKKGFEEITSHLIEQGHRKIVFVGSWVNRISSEQERYNGFCQAHINHGVPLMKKNLYSFSDAEAIPDGYRENLDKDIRKIHYLLDILEKYPAEERPTAIAAVNDLIARLIMTTAQERGIAIPSFYSLTGFDNLPYAAHLPIPLTTVEQPAYEIGKQAAEILFRAIDRQENQPVSCTIPPHLIIRESTDCVV